MVGAPLTLPGNSVPTSESSILAAVDPLTSTLATAGFGMSNISVQKFVELVRRSRLASEADVQRVVAAARENEGGALPEDPQALADAFVAAELLTPWHVDNLLRGKYKGFFLGKYKLLRHLGTGGMSSVYLAEHSLMGRHVAIKVLPKSRVSDSSYLARFLREARAAASLSHRNIVKAFDVDNDGDQHYLVMEYVRGQDLQQRIADDGPLGIGKAADYIAQAARGLQHAHEASLIHRDIKPANLLVDEQETVKILDLGLALVSSDEDMASLTIAHNENVLGTADYLSPEQAKNSHDVDARADIYSLGCTLYFTLAGHAPFPDGTLAQRIAKHLTEMPESLRTVRDEVPAALSQICERMMAKRREDRYRTAAEAAKALERFAAAWANGSSPKLVAAGTKAIHNRRRTGDSGRDLALPRKPAEDPHDSRRKPNDLEDTVSDRERGTVKGLRRGDSSKRGKDLPVAKPLDGSGSDVRRPREGFPFENLETRSARPEGGIPDLKIDTSKSAAGEGSQPTSGPTGHLWIWIGLAIGGLVLLVAIVVAIAISVSSEPNPPRRPPRRDTADLLIRPGFDAGPSVASAGGLVRPFREFSS